MKRIKDNYQLSIQNILDMAGIVINGDKPWDVQVHNKNLYKRVLREGSLGLGESYMDGWWDVASLDQFFYKIFISGLRNKIRPNLKLLFLYVRSWLQNMQSKNRASIVAKKHYDLSSELYMSFLDPYNQYTCGYFKDNDDLNIAQEQKLDLICKKLYLKPHDRILDIGCGWGGFAKYAAEHYGCHVTGITISKEQFDYAKDFTKHLPVEIKMMDYRDLQGSFDKILICGMIEHVGYKNYRNIMEVVSRCLKKDGLFLLHTIGNNRSVRFTDPWLDKYIFPNSMLPSIPQLSSAFEGLFIMEDWHNFGPYYDPTLMAWYSNFDKNWIKLKDKYDERFYRMWRYYLLSCAGLFRAREAQLWQIVLSHPGSSGIYKTFR